MEYIRSIPTHMDYKGQKLAEQLFQGIILLFAVVGFVWGYVCEQFVQTIYILGAGFILSCILTLPPWSIYRRSPVQWQKPRVDSELESKEVIPTKEKKSSRRKEKTK
ncbi:signal peptidase complex subunit 1-like [Asterias rubens]|uniref:signal peptidase complex subunit 1-like n=1 Tax=Asterias rubens TaxID=7604 RepID=UPI0014550733|nr:signal peptidase complex subunit 1-like [Asterias rubens]